MNTRTKPQPIVVLYGRWPTRVTATAVLTDRDVCQQLARESARQNGFRSLTRHCTATA